MSAQTDSTLRGVCFLIRSLGYGGAERQLVNLAVGLHRRGHTVTVVTYYAGGALAGPLSEAGVPVRNLGKRGRWDLLAPWLAFRRVIKARRPRVLHGYLPDANMVCLYASRILPGCGVVWGVRGSDLDLSHFDWLTRLIDWVTVRLSRKADLVIANSKAGARADISRGFPADRMGVVPNGIDVERFRPDPEARQRQRKLWGFDEGNTVIGIVGRLSPMKDHKTFLRAAGRYAQQRGDLRFVVVGNGPEAYREELKRLAQDQGIAQKVTWAEASQDVAAVYNGLDLLTSSSSYGEGFSNVLGEAMACGVPCVATDTGDSAWIVGESGEVIKPGDPLALAGAWETLLRRKAAGIDPDPRKRIVAEFSIERLVTNTEALLMPWLGKDAQA